MMTQTNAPNIEAARTLTGGPVLYPGTTIETPVPEIHGSDFEWTVTFYQAESEIEELSLPNCRSTFRSKALTFEEERAVNSEELSDFGRTTARRLYDEAAGEALALLKEYSERNPYRSSRLRARVCAAIRAELAALVEDWDALNGGEA